MKTYLIIAYILAIFGLSACNSGANPKNNLEQISHGSQTSAICGVSSQATYFYLTNMTNSTIISTAVSGIDECDWNQASKWRPDLNLVNLTVEPFHSVYAREEINTLDSTNPFALSINLKDTSGNITTISIPQELLDMHLANGGETTEKFWQFIDPNGKYDAVILNTSNTPHNLYLTIIPHVDVGNWLSTISDNTNLGDLTIPGTHDSSTWNIQGLANDSPYHEIHLPQEVDLSMTQSSASNYIQQLNDGIRFFDIRVRSSTDNGGTWYLHHGSTFLSLDFDYTLKQITEWMSAHPKETVLISIKKEQDAKESNAPEFDDMFKLYQDRYPNLSWYTENRLPKLGEVRGKLVLIDRYDGGSVGLMASNWGNSDVPFKLRIQDQYTDVGQTKTDEILSFINSYGSLDSTLKFNFLSTSGSGSLCGEIISFGLAGIPAICKDKTVPILFAQLFGSLLNINTPSGEDPVSNGVLQYDLRHQIYPMDFYNQDLGFVRILAAVNYSQ